MKNEKAKHDTLMLEVDEIKQAINFYNNDKTKYKKEIRELTHDLNIYKKVFMILFNEEI